MYTGTCASPKGTFRCSHFSKGDVQDVLGIESSLRGMWWYPAQRLRIEKYWALLSLKKMSLTFGMCQTNFWYDFVQGSVADDKVSSTVTLRYDNDQSWPAEMATVYDFCIWKLVDLVLYTVIVFHGNRVWPVWDTLRGTCVNLYFS